ncbi:hypothetical protein M8494_06765 [Serratia ureilytica]
MAQNNLNKSQSSLGTAIERLSSGLRINSAKTMLQVRLSPTVSLQTSRPDSGFSQRQRRYLSGCQTTERRTERGINDNLQNIRRLTVQSQNGSNSASDLQSIGRDLSASV